MATAPIAKAKDWFGTFLQKKTMAYHHPGFALHTTSPISLSAEVLSKVVYDAPHAGEPTLHGVVVHHRLV